MNRIIAANHYRYTVFVVVILCVIYVCVVGDVGQVQAPQGIVPGHEANQAPPGVNEGRAPEGQQAGQIQPPVGVADAHGGVGQEEQAGRPGDKQKEGRHEGEHAGGVGQEDHGVAGVKQEQQGGQDQEVDVHDDPDQNADQVGPVGDGPQAHDGHAVQGPPDYDVEAGKQMHQNDDGVNGANAGGDENGEGLRVGHMTGEGEANPKPDGPQHHVYDNEEQQRHAGVGKPPQENGGVVGVDDGRPAVQAGGDQVDDDQEIQDDTHAHAQSDRRVDEEQMNVDLQHGGDPAGRDPANQQVVASTHTHTYTHTHTHTHTHTLYCYTMTPYNKSLLNN